ncbi:MAG: hypothetical protein WCK00_00880 [Deltaproteobacteria bacterium]
MSRKSLHWKVPGVSKAVILAAFALFFLGVDVVAQTPPDMSYEKNDAVAVNALNCWWKTDKNSVRIGEEFTVALTCRSAETSLEKTVLDDSLLEPSVLFLPPYQVKGGSRYKELSRVLPGPDGPVTFHTVQYAYTVKLIGEGFFGRDVPLPPLEIRYHIDLVTNKDAVAPGKDRTYVLPPLPMRIQSLVPKAADAIRDAGNETFGDIERRRKGAVIAFIAAGFFLLLLLVVMLPILVRTIRGRRESVSNGTVFHDKDLLRHLVSELDRIEKNRRTAPWDEASIGTVLAVFRVGGALAVGRRVVQKPVEFEARGMEGQLKFRKGFWPRTKVLVSASLTPEEIAKELAGANWQGAGKARRKVLLDEIQRAFAAFNGARYATPGNTVDLEALDGALKKGVRFLRALQHDRFLFARVMRTAGERGARWRQQWKRS